MDSSGPLDLVDPNVPFRHLQGKFHNAEKPLPPPPGPLERLRSETPNSSSTANVPESPSHGIRPSLAAQTSFQRPRKRVLVGNKGCIIALPLENEHGRTTTRESYLKPEDVERRLKDWENKGYDTRGFILASPSVESAPFIVDGQSRAIHPDPEEERRERSHRSFRVSIPDRREWEAYVDFLKEEKLRALGVSFGDEEAPSRKSPAPSLMSRGASSQGSSMLLSPPLAPSSIGAMPLSPQFQGHPNPNAPPGKQAISHFQRYSVVSPFDGNPFQASNQFPQSRSPGNGSWSPQPFLSSQPNSRIGSPLANGHVQNFSRGFSPGPPVHQNSIQKGPPQNPTDLLSQMRSQQAALQAQQTQQQQQQQQQQQRILLPRPQPASTVPRPIEIDLSKTQSIPHPHIVTPTPRGHRQNPSETLQREVDEAEAALEAAAKEDGATNNLSIDGKADNQEQNGGSISKIQEEHGEGPKTDLEIKVAFQPDEIPEEPEHAASRDRSKSSASKLNVNAPEFKFEPKKPTAPNVFSFLGNQETTQPFHGLPPPNVEKSALGHTKKPSVGAASRFNVAAPIFTPQSAPKPSVPSREFSFSSSGPSFNPDAPVFNPDAPAFKPNEPAQAVREGAKGNENPIEAVKRIFGDIKFAEVIKPAKKSKALPIVPPLGITDTESAGNDGQEDESGRITQADGRQKRARREQDDGDQVPMFASPQGTPYLDDGKEDRAAYFGNSESSSSENDEATTLEAATDLLEEILDEMPASEAESLLRETDPSEADEKSATAYAFHDVDQAAEFNAALPLEIVTKERHSRIDPTPQNVAEATINFLNRSAQYTTEFNEELERRVSGVSPISPLSPASEERHLPPHRDNDQIDRIDHAKHSVPLRQDILDGVRYVEPSYDEIDAVMQHLNEDSDLGVERRASPRVQVGQARSPARSPFQDSAVQHQLLPHPHLRSDAPSPSPNRLKENFQYLPPTDSESVGSAVRDLVAHNARFSPSYRPSKSSPPINRLNSRGSSPPSEWNDAISSADEDKFHSRTGFFDHRVNDLVGGIIQQRLGPLEKTLAAMSHNIEKLSGRSSSRRPRSSGTMEIVNSDADDEDDEQPLERSSSRLKSPVRDRKFDQLRTTISEIAAAQKGFAPANQLAEVMEAVKDLRASMQQAPAAGRQTPVGGDLKAVVEEAVGRQMRGRSGPITSSSNAAAAEKSSLQIAGLESMLKIAEGRAEDELKARRSTEDALADSQRLLRAALQEAAEQRESAEETERSLQEYHGEQHQLLKRMASLEGSQEQLEKMASDLSEKNVALEGTLGEYRLSSDSWRTDIDDAKHENKDLRRHINSLKADNEHLVHERQLLRTKFDTMQDTMHAEARQIAAEQARWHGKEEEHKTRLGMLSARLEAEARTRERLEVEIERLEAQEKESMKARFQVDQMQKANAHLDKLVGMLKAENHEHQNKASRLERDLHAANETKIMEVHRTRSAMEVDIESAESQVNVVRSELQSVIARLEKQLETVAADAGTTNSRHELMLEEASESRHTALREAADAREAALQEHYRFHERTLGEMKAEHQRALENALEDKQRSQTHFGNRLSLADEKATHQQDQISLLEEKLEIAKSAAHAAVQAAKAQKSPSAATASVAAITERSSPSRREFSSIPEKVSPQALRESILVLQEQLQARETRIEDLEFQLSAIDTEAPTKLKEADIEITWLRELLGVRIDDLEDIIKTLSQPSYDREAVKDAVIRLRANLQMEQQEKERALAGGTAGSFPSLSSLAASPRAALPLAAAAAWGNWRKGRDSAFGSLSGIAKGSASTQQTPSKSNTPQSLFAGLMTPPSTDMRSTPPYQSNSRPTSSSTISNRPFRSRGGPSTPRQSFGGENAQRPLMNKGGPVTPPLNLMRKASYDLDAREGSGFDTSPRGGRGEVEGFDEGVYEVVGEEEEPFGPRIGTFVG